MRIVLLMLALLGAVAPSVGSANCLARSQNAIALVQIANAYSISRYTWAGDPQYDQVMPLCSKTAIREFACNAGINIAIRELENHTAPNSKFVCVANYIGAAAFAFYIRKAVGVQLFSLRF